MAGAILDCGPEGEKEEGEEEKCGQFGGERRRRLAEELGGVDHLRCRHFLLFGILDWKSNFLSFFFL